MTSKPRPAQKHRLSWVDFEKYYIEPAVRARLDVLGNSHAQVLHDPLAAKLCIRIKAPNNERIPAKVPRSIQVRYILWEGSVFLEVLTTDPALYRPFFYLMMNLVDHLERGHTPVEAFSRALAEYETLLRPSATMSEEEAIGLFGELVILRDLIAALGIDGVQSWTGVESTSHDFRFHGIELEIKTSRSSQRQHRIHGLQQLKPSDASKLYLVSILVEPAGVGSGQSLGELVSAISMALGQSSSHLQVFRDGLANRGWRDPEQDGAARFVLRGVPMYVPVEDGFPGITSELLCQVMKPEVVGRISKVEYSINVEGLCTELSIPALISGEE